MVPPLRYYDVAAGAVRVNGADVRRVTQRSLRAAIGLVPQDTPLFNDTILYNIRFFFVFSCCCARRLHSSST